MSNRSFVLSVVLILAVAMFASNLGTDSSNDVSGMQPFPVTRQSTCGDGVCNFGEDIISCSQDCANPNAVRIPTDACKTIYPSALTNPNANNGHELCALTFGSEYRCIDGHEMQATKAYTSSDTSCTGLNYLDSSYQTIPCEVMPHGSMGNTWSACFTDNGVDMEKWKDKTTFNCCPRT